MLKNEREQEILEILRETGYASVRHLSETLYTSESSVRRALTDLERKKLVKRSYGGAELLDHHSNVVAFGARAHHNIAAKQEIAKKAAALVPDGSVLFLDQSSTTFFLAREILKKKALTIVTNSPELLSLFAGSDFAVYSSGGKLSDENRTCLVGRDAQKTFENIYADFMFFSAKALSEDGIIWDCTQEEVLIREPMLKNSDKKVFLCDSEKFNTHSVYRQCSLSEVDYLVSEREYPKAYHSFSRTLTLL